MESSGRTYFLANVCHVCKSKLANIPCGICNMIFYCCSEHRRQNWYEHSELCWAINKITESGSCRCLWELYDGKDFTGFRHSVANKCTDLLKRNLKPWEFELVYYPRMCNVCRDFNWENLSPCKNCEFVYTCGKNHFRKDHSQWCQTMKTYSELIVSQSLGIDVKPFRLEIKNGSHKSMSDVLKQNSDKNIQLQSVVTSELLTYPMTVLHGLTTINSSRSNKLTILFIGAEIQAEVQPLDKWEQYLLHSLNDVDYLCLKFLGPQLQETSQELLGNLCETCRERRKNLKFQFISGKFYHEYSTNGTEQPDLICALNSGMYRDFGFERKNSWEETIRKLFTRGSPPVLITEYTCRELKMVLDRIRNLCGDVRVVAQPEVNPYASLKPGLNIISEDEIPVVVASNCITPTEPVGVMIHKQVWKIGSWEIINQTTEAINQIE